jgi:hypothetical protein
MRRQNCYSESWGQAADKFAAAASEFGGVKWAKSKDAKFPIPYVSIGAGTDKIVINSGVHGLEGYFGSAAQLMILYEIIPNLSPVVLKKYTIVLIHAINGWGMENRMREVMDPNGGLVDLNRNFGVDFSNPEMLPRNELYKHAHGLLVSDPHVKNPGKDNPTKANKLYNFRKQHLKDGVWASISRGQYYEPYGLFYGGSAAMPENKMTMRIYDEIMAGATSLISIGLHTGLGRFYKNKGYVTTSLQVSHEECHPNTVKFREIFADVTEIESSAPLLGDLVDCLEGRYAHMNIPIYTADYEIGTGEWPVRSVVLKRMDMGDARYDLMRKGKISSKTSRNLTESWYPSHPVWRRCAIDEARRFFKQLIQHLNCNEP